MAENVIFCGGAENTTWWQILMFKIAESALDLSDFYPCAKNEAPASNSFCVILLTWRICSSVKDSTISYPRFWGILELTAVKQKK